MKNSFNLNIIFSFAFLVSTIVLNQYSWLLLFDLDGSIYLWKIIIFCLLDLFLIISAILFYINRRQKNYFIYYSKLISFNSIIIISLLVILELVFGNWLNPDKLSKLNIIKDRTINYKLHDLYPWDTDHIIYTRDKWGFRGKYSDVDSIDILTIGGSTTDQRYISDGYTFQDVLQKEFLKNGKDVFVVNAGINGQSTFGNIKNFDWWFPNIQNLKVKYFLIYVGVNDFYKDPNYSFDNLVKESINPIRKTIHSSSALYNLYKTIEGAYFAHVFGLRHDVGHTMSEFSTKNWVDQPRLSNYEEIMSNRLDAYEQRLNILCEKVKSFGSIPIFVSQSQRRVYDFIDQHLYGQTSVVQNYEGHLVNGVDYYYMIQLLHKRTKKVSDKNGGIFINLDQELKFDIENDFYDSNHSTPSGAKKIGEYLYKNLKHRF